MLFVDLHDLNPEGNAWSKEEEDKVCTLVYGPRPID